MGNIPVHDCPEPLNWVEMWVIWRQLYQVDMTVFAQQESPNMRPFVIGYVIPNDIYYAFIEVAGFNFSQQLHRTCAIEGDWFDKRRMECLKT
jgi:hypothetical protein